MEALPVAWRNVTTLTGSTRSLIRARARGEVLKIRPRVYLPTSTWVDMTPWDRFGLVAAAVAAARPDAAFTGATAAYFHGIPTLDLPAAVQVQVAETAHARRYPAIGDTLSTVRGRQRWGLHLVPGTGPASQAGGMPVVPVEFAVGQLAAGADRRTAVAAIDALRHRRLGTESDDEALLDRWMEGRSLTAAARIRQAWDASDPLSESILETIFRLGAVTLGFERPQLQVPVGPYRVDAAWPAARIVAECDGQGKYGATAEEQSLARREERTREEVIKRAGFHVFRVTWRDVLDLTVLRTALSGNGVPLAVESRRQSAA